MTAVVASLSTVALAANHIATTAEGLCYLPAYGISFAGIALVGQAVGAGSEEDAQAYGRLAALLGFFLTLGTAVALFLLAPYLAALFNSDAEVVAQAALMLRIVSVSEPFFALSIILSGALRARTTCASPWWWGCSACGACASCWRPSWCTGRAWAWPAYGPRWPQT